MNCFKNAMKLLGGEHRRTSPAEIYCMKFGLVVAVGKQGGVVAARLVEFNADGRDHGRAVL